MEFDLTRIMTLQWMDGQTDRQTGRQIHHLGHIREQGAAGHHAQPRHQGGRRCPGVLQHLQPTVSLLRHRLLGAGGEGQRATRSACPCRLPE